MSCSVSDLGFQTVLQNAGLSRILMLKDEFRINCHEAHFAGFGESIIIFKIMRYLKQNVRNKYLYCTVSLLNSVFLYQSPKGKIQISWGYAGKITFNSRLEEFKILVFGKIYC